MLMALIATVGPGGRMMETVSVCVRVQGLVIPHGCTRPLRDSPISAGFCEGQSFEFEIFFGKCSTSSRLSDRGYVVPDGAEDLPQVPFLVLSPACAPTLLLLLLPLPFPKSRVHTKERAGSQARAHLCNPIIRELATPPTLGAAPEPGPCTLII
ncbi:unnamed protein product [Pleuronectes platessa]|uniref:Uncharacterized protein n=1 Tax=Pleuronectes platessa TaxID=8262 RepID=A0A9N7Z1N1_PLEPL|nr:unnamed protein product [Pleuronectes platessa]